MKINNRRYIGCKTKLLDFIYNTVTEYGFDNSNLFADIFAGTGVVAYKFASNGYKTILNDNLYSNYVVYNAFFSNEKIRSEKINNLLSNFNTLKAEELEDNYFSKVYGGKYFHKNDAKKIGYIRETIEKQRKKLNKREYYYLITSLLYTTDKIANTVGHFESFLKREPAEKGVFLDTLDIDANICDSSLYNMDTNELVKKISCDICYIDPPYNARQYVNFYHVLENLARWNKPTEFEGNSMKFKRNELKSDYCRKKAPQKFEELINDINCKLILVSYNNTYKAGSISSINTITEDQIINILNKKGKTYKKEITYKAFNAGKTELNGHKEFLFICEVGK